MKICNETDYANENEVLNEYPSAVKIEEVEGGWMAFDSWDEYGTWKRQA